jgi:hypothetical protein
MTNQQTIAAYATGALGGLALILSQTDYSEYSIYTVASAAFTGIGYLWMKNRESIIDNIEDALEDAGIDADVDDLVDKVADSVKDVAEDTLEAAEDGKDLGEALKDAVEDEIEEETGAVVDLDELSNLTVAGLKHELKELNLPTTGRKAELIERLKNALEG